MSALFTPPASWVNRKQDLNGANEIVQAFWERNYVSWARTGEIQLLQKGDDSTFTEYWYGTILTWMFNNCNSFVDHVNGPLNAGKTDFLYFTLDTFLAAAGLNWSSLMAIIMVREQKALFFETIQNLLSVLRWTVRDLGRFVRDGGTTKQNWSPYVGGGLNGHSIYIIDGEVWNPPVYYGTMEIAMAYCESNWSPPGTEFSQRMPFQSRSGKMGQAMPYGHDYTAELYREYGNIVADLDIGAGSVLSNYSVDLYLLAASLEPQGGDGYTQHIAFDAFDDFLEAENNLIEDELVLVASSGQISAPSFSFSVANNLRPGWCDSYPTSPPYWSQRGYQVTRAPLLYKWDFTNQNA